MEYSANNARTDSQAAYEALLENNSAPILAAIQDNIYACATNFQRCAVHVIKGGVLPVVIDRVERVLAENGYEVKTEALWFGRYRLTITW